MDGTRVSQGHSVRGEVPQAAGGRACLHINHKVGPPRGVRISPVTSKPCWL